MIRIATICFCLASSALAQSSQRHFIITQSATIDGLAAGESVRVWMPVPPQTTEQRSKDLGATCPAGTFQDNSDETTGNIYRSFSSIANTSGTLSFSNRWDIVRHQAGIIADDHPILNEALRANRLIPINGTPMRLLKNISLSDDPMTRGRQLFDVVEQTMDYRKDQPGWGRGDAAWACDSHFGNCTDFHSLFISLARSEELPAVFEIGFPIPTDKSEGVIGGYHCWAWFYAAGRGWVPVDISESKQTGIQQFALLTPDRVMMTRGRDLQLIPKQDGPPVNFFVEPYVEVNAKPLDKSRVHTQVTFKDVAE